MKILRPDAADPFEDLAAQTEYFRYLDVSTFPAQVSEYVKDPRVRERGDPRCAHDYYLESVLSSDPLAGKDRTDSPRIQCCLHFVCIRRGSRLIFRYTGVVSFGCDVTRGAWPGSFPQVLQDEVTLEGRLVRHEWALENHNSICIMCSDFSYSLEKLT